MAHHFTNADWQRRLALSSGVKGRTGVPVLEGSVQPVVIVDDLQRTPDLSQGVRQAFCTQAATGNGANTIDMTLSNLFTTSSVFVRLDRLIVSTGNTCQINLRIAGGGIGINTFGTYVNPGAPQLNGVLLNSAVGLSATLTAVQAPNIAQFDLLANTPFQFDFSTCPVVLSPGFLFGICQNAIGINTTRVSIGWTEFPLSPRG